MYECEAQLLFRSTDPAVRFLPEGPFPCGPNQFSWVAIQHGGDATRGSLHQFDLTTGQDAQFDLPGRPGFAYPIAGKKTFVVGLERHVGEFDPATGSFEPLSGVVDADVTGTIINDGTLFDGGLIFGCKDLKFTEKKAGLYLLRTGERQLITLRRDQICSNGKQVVQRDGQWTLLDIDSPTKTVVGYPFDLSRGTLGTPQVVIDLTHGPSFPDGMEITPDGQSIIIAFYDPRDVAHGEARQYRLADGQVEAIWRTPGSPRVTCPRLIGHAGRVKLVLTTAVEHMTAEQAALHPTAGGLFIADTPFDRLPPQRQFVL